MRQSVVIDLTGHGHFHYMMACASCSMADMPYGTMDFTLTSVSDGTASGSVTVSSDPQHPVGEPGHSYAGPSGHHPVVRRRQERGALLRLQPSVVRLLKDDM